MLIARLSSAQEDGEYLFNDCQLGLAEGTIRRRVARLLDEKVLEIVGVTDPQSRHAYRRHRRLECGTAVIEDTIERLKQMPEVRYIAATVCMCDH